jgi:hypothetical protein
MSQEQYLLLDAFRKHAHILRKIPANELGDLGDTSTPADLSVVESLIANRKNVWSWMTGGFLSPG